MVTTPLPPPHRNSAADLMRAVRNGPPVCLVCNTKVDPTGRKRGQGELRWCENCKSFEKTYRGPPRPSLCASCINNVKPKAPNDNVAYCASLMYQMPDGTWRDRYNQAKVTTYREGGVIKDERDVFPHRRTKPEYVCELYERLADGETRESVRINDPLRFHHRSRFFSD